MSLNYAKTASLGATPQTQPIPGRTDMVQNNASGFVFKISIWDKLMRFLIIGTEGGTYYVGEKKLTREAASSVLECIKEDPRRVLEAIRSVSLQGRAAKQGPTIFSLALLAANVTDEKVKAEVKNSVFDVCRTSTMLFEYLSYVKELRGLGPSIRKSIAKYYEQTPVDKLDMHLVKYRERNGFTHRDVMRLAHPKTTDAKRNSLFGYAVGKTPAPQGSKSAMYEVLKNLDPNKKGDVALVINAIQELGMPREGLPTAFLNNKEVWKALLVNMPINALVRNLGKMSSIGLFDSNTREEVSIVVNKLTNPEEVKKSRIHPIQVLSAIKVYTSGRGVKGSLTWNSNSKIADALDTCMYLAFKNVVPTGKRYLVGMDVSGSMGSPVLGMDNLSAYEATAALAAIINQTEDKVDFVGFGCKGGYSKQEYGWMPNGINKQRYGYGASGLTPLDFSKKDRMDTILAKMRALHMGGTDCSLPILYATEKKIPVDVFIITTDNETYAGTTHPMQALQQYRKVMGINAKLIVLATSVTDFSIADANDPGALDVAGFDASVMGVISEFVK